MARDAWGSYRLELVDPALPPVLARGGLDRAAARRDDADWLDRAWRRSLVVGLAADGAVQVVGPDVAFQPATGERDADAWFLGVDGNGPEATAYFATVGDPSTPGMQGTARSLRELGPVLTDRDAAVLGTAVGLLHWHQAHGYCPRDGAPTRVASAGWVRVCPSDGRQLFPRTDPAVIALVTTPDGAQALLGRAPGWPRNRYSCLAGFVEPGESAEQAVVREIGEEAGILVTNVHPVASQPWPFPSSLMLGFRATGSSSDPLVRAEDELEDVRWFTRDDLLDGVVLLPPPVSIANHLIARWLAEGQEPAG